jgi:hypothetical protein
MPRSSGLQIRNSEGIVTGMILLIKNQAFIKSRIPMIQPSKLRDLQSNISKQRLVIQVGLRQQFDKLIELFSHHCKKKPHSTQGFIYFSFRMDNMSTIAMW